MNTILSMPRTISIAVSAESPMIHSVILLYFVLSRCFVNPLESLRDLCRQPVFMSDKADK